MISDEMIPYFNMLHYGVINLILGDIGSTSVIRYKSPCNLIKGIWVSGWSIVFECSMLQVIYLASTMDKVTENSMTKRLSKKLAWNICTISINFVSCTVNIRIFYKFKVTALEYHKSRSLVPARHLNILFTPWGVILRTNWNIAHNKTLNTMS